MNRYVWLATAALLLDALLYCAVPPLLPEYAERFQLSKTGVGLAVAAFPLLILIAGLPAGLIADRLGARRLLVAGATLGALCAMGYGWIRAGWQLAAVRAAHGLASTLVSVSGTALLASSAAPGKRGRTLAVGLSLAGIGAVVGPAFSGFAAPWLGIETAFLALAALGAALAVVGVASRERPSDRDRLSANRSAIQTLRSPAVRGAASSALCVGLLGGAITTLVPLGLADAGYSRTAIAAVFMTGALLSLVTTPFVGRGADAAGAGRVAAGCLALIFTLALALAAPTPVWIEAAVVIALMPILWAGGTLAYALAAYHAPLGEGLGAGFGLALAGWSVGAIAGPIAAGTIADATSNDLAFLAVALATAILALPVVGVRELGQSDAPSRRSTSFEEA
jgi:MFS family permease